MDCKELVNARPSGQGISMGRAIKIKQEVDDEFCTTNDNYEGPVKTIKKEAADEDVTSAIEYTDDMPSPMELLMYGSDSQSRDVNDSSYDEYEIVIKAEPQLDISDDLESEPIDQLDASQKYSCSHCDFDTELKYYLDIHNEMMHPRRASRNAVVDPTDLACPHCDHEANNKFSLKRHIMSNHVVGEKRYACYICDFTTTNLLVLQSHRSCHRSDETYSCPHCTFKCTQLAVMRAHERKHLLKMSDQKLLFCGQCDYRSFFKYSLKMHSKVHLVEKPPEPIHSCTLCEFQTKRLRVLKVHHRRIHLHEEPFVCPTCKHTYSSNGSLSRHLKTHAKEEHFIKCTECDYKTLQYSSMKGHMRTHSRPLTTYTCDRCDYNTVRKTLMQSHMKTHRRSMNCSHCGFKTNIQAAFKKHLCSVRK